MSHYTGAVPASRRPTDWRDDAACRDEDPEIFFALDSTAAGRRDIEQAKTICGSCPSQVACLRYALDTNINDGIYGGRTEKERRSKRRQTQPKERRKREPKPPKAPAEPPPTTVEEAYERRARTAAGGHVLWYGAAQLRFQTVKYNPLRLAFEMGHGRTPQGRVERTCGRKCYAPEHLTDEVIRDAQDLCGTTTGYWRHRKKGEPTCAPCRRANADADNRLRWTGTTKQAV